MSAEPTAVAYDDVELLPHGSLADVVAELGDRADLGDLYDQQGARAYDDSAQIDRNEIRALRRALKRSPGPVLELAAGSGRLTLPLLRMGRQVTALELSASMVAQLEENAADWPADARARLEVHHGDMTEFDLPQPYGVVVLVAASISLLDHDQRLEMLRTVRQHLAPGGVLLLSIGASEAELDSPDDVVDEVVGRSGQRYRIHQYRDVGSSKRHVGVYPVLDDPTAVVPIGLGIHRVLDVETVRAEIEAVGMSVLHDESIDSGTHTMTEIFLEIGERP